MEKLFVVLVVVIVFCFTIGQLNRDNKVYECKLEAIKALQDPKMIKQICGE
jgi:hypothetical protein